MDRISQILVFIFIFSAVFLQTSESRAKWRPTILEFTSFFDDSPFQTNGAAVGLSGEFGTGSLGITQAIFGQGPTNRRTGSVFLHDGILLADETGYKASFSTFFSFQIDGSRGDGFTFCLQSVDRNQLSSGSLGYAGIPRSIAVEFDTFYNASEDLTMTQAHLGVDLNGFLVSTFQTPAPAQWNNGDVWYVWIEFDGDSKILEIRYTNYINPGRPIHPAVRLPLNLAQILSRRNETPIVWPGFTSSVFDGVGAAHNILSWSFINKYEPILHPFGTLGKLGKQRGVEMKEFVTSVYSSLAQGQREADQDYRDTAFNYVEAPFAEEKQKLTIPRYTVPSFILDVKFKVSGDSPLTIEAERTRLQSVANSRLVSMHMEFEMPAAVQWIKSNTNGTDVFDLQFV